MKYYIYIVLLVCFIYIYIVSGCVCAKYHDLYYLRLGSQELDNVSVTDPNGINIQIGKQKSEELGIRLAK